MKVGFSIHFCKFENCPKACFLFEKQNKTRPCETSASNLYESDDYWLQDR